MTYVTCKKGFLDTVRQLKYLSVHRLLTNRPRFLPCVIWKYYIFHKCLSKAHYLLSHKCYIFCSHILEQRSYKETQLSSGYASCHGPEYLF